MTTQELSRAIPPFDLRADHQPFTYRVIGLDRPGERVWLVMLKGKDQVPTGTVIEWPFRACKEMVRKK